MRPVRLHQDDDGDLHAAACLEVAAKFDQFRVVVGGNDFAGRINWKYATPCLTSGSNRGFALSHWSLLEIGPRWRADRNNKKPRRPRGLPGRLYLGDSISASAILMPSRRGLR